MRFGNALTHIVRQVLTADPNLGPVYLSKLDLSNACMRLWVRLEDTPFTASLLTKLHPADKHLVGFHLSLPMGWVDRTSYFCMVMEMVTDLENQAMPVRNTAPPTNSRGRCRHPNGDRQRAPRPGARP